MAHYRVTYAQNREDLILEGILRSVSTGFYVDVGANHPEIDSVTKIFYDKGWSGINVEPHEHLIRELARQRPRDINVHAGVSSQPGTMQLFTHDAKDGLSTFSADLKQMYVGMNTSQHRESSVEILTLYSILTKHRPTGDIHFLKVDVEGLELEVLLGNKWHQFRPWVMCLERGISPPRTAAINAFLGACNYFAAFYDGINDYYIAGERRALWNDFSYAREMILNGVPVHASVLPQLAQVSAPAIATAPPQPTPSRGTVHVDELLALEGEAFVRAAYAAVLQRDTDSAGLANYLAELKAGVRKIQILRKLRHSTEGRRHGVMLAGLRRAMLKEGLRLVGPRASAEPDKAQSSAVGNAPEFHSRFGGLWIDRKDFPQQLEQRIHNGRVPAYLAPVIRDFERDGYAVLERAVPEDELARFEKIISAAFRDGQTQLLTQDPGESATRAPTAGMDRRGVRIVDCFGALPEALDVLSAPRLVEFLKALFEEQPKLFQSLSFDMGSEQGLHQDTAYVVVNRPLELVGCWIALEDVRPGSGELQYIIGSHRLPDFDFGSGKKHWIPVLDTSNAHAAWSRWLIEESQKRAFPLQTFLAKRGDVLLWHADLVHGGAPVKDPALTRKSLVGHFCPASVAPVYAQETPTRATTLSHRGIAYSSWYYDLAPMSAPRLGTTGG